MSDAMFPSGPWTGFYNYGPGDRHRMDLLLTFSGGSLTGEGGDDIGRFLIRGKYDASSGECYWTKTYLGAHEVYYRGFREGKGIWGTWEINLFGHGGFHIWPRREGDGEPQAMSKEEPVEAVGSETETPVTVGNLNFDPSRGWLHLRPLTLSLRRGQRILRGSTLGRRF